MNLSYGEFNPRFPGISLTVDTPERLDKIQRYSLGPEIPQNLQNLEYGISDQEFMDSAACLTVGPHETRHFHDYLISNIGAHEMRTRFALASNLIHLMHIMVTSQILEYADYVPVPLTKWCTMPLDKRAAFEADMTAAGYNRALALPSIDKGAAPDITDEPQEATSWLGKLIAVCNRYQNSLRPLPGLTDIGLMPIHLWEASALLVQCEELYGAVSAEAAERFHATLIQSDNKYGTALQQISMIWPYDGDVPIYIASIMLGWCLLGDYREAGDHASPAIRIGLLWHIFRREPLETLLPGDDVEKIFGAWDRLTRQPSTLAGIRRSLDDDSAVIASAARQNERSDPALRDELELTLSDYRECANARRYMVERFLAAPEEYLIPRQYLNAFNHWTAPALKIDHLNGALKVNKKDRKHWYIHEGWEQQDGSIQGVITGPPLILPGVQHISRESAFRQYSLFTAADVVFGPERADMPNIDKHIAQAVFDEIRVVRFFD